MKANEVYTKLDFIQYLKQIGAKFEEITVSGMEFVYVYDKAAYDNKAGYIPYIRVSHFEDELWYVRDCGWCDDYEPEAICKKAWRMTRRKESA